MIGTIDVKVQAHNPNFPLDPVFTFVNSSQSFRIRDVPKRIGNWSITNVFVNITYPDNTVFSKECLLVGGVWVGTVNGCSSSGQVEKGFVVTASGIDENNQTVSNYVLGAGDIYVKKLDGTVTPGKTSIRMFFYETIPTSPNEGDSTFIEGVLNVYDGTQWKPVAQQSDPSYIEDSNGNKINADRSVVIGSNFWMLNNSSQFTGTKTNSVYEITDSVKQTLQFNEGYWTFKDYEWAGEYWSEYYSETISGSESNNELSFNDGVYTLNWTSQTSNNTLALTSELPTKTSDLTNDSGFITVSQVPTQTFIQDNDGNKIEADLDCYVRNLTLPWTIDKEEWEEPIQLNWDASLNYWIFENSQEKYTLQFINNQTDVWKLDYYIFDGETWFINYSVETYGPIGATSLEFPTSITATRSILEEKKVATLNDLPTKTSDLTNDSNFITSEQVEPFYNFGSTASTGTARYAACLYASTGGSGKLDTDGWFEAQAKIGTDLTPQLEAHLAYSTYYNFVLSKFFSQTYSPSLQLIFWKNGSIKKLVNNRPRTYYDGCMYRTADAGFAIPCSSEGVPDGRLIEFTQVSTSYIAFTNEDTQVHTITGNTYWTSIETIDGQSGEITCTRTNQYRMNGHIEKLAKESQLPTKTSDLTNDSGFITSANIITKRDLNDLNIYVDPMADMTTTKFTVVVSYAGDPSTPLYTVELTHRGGEETAWTWSPSGSNQRISIDYSSVTGDYGLHYYNLQDGGGNEHSGSMTTPLTSPYWTGEAQDDWFHFSVTSQTTTITTKAYVDAQIGQVLTEEF